MEAFMTIIAAILGAVVAGVFTMFGVTRAARAARIAERDRDRQEIANVRKALLAELLSMKDRYMDGIGNHLEEHPEGAAFDCIYPAYQRYFVIFEENARFIGKIPDDRERDLIVNGYTTAKGLLDSYKLNNSMVEKWNYARGLGPAVLGVNSTPVAREIERLLCEYAPVLKDIHRESLELHQQLVESLQQPLQWKEYENE